MDLGKNVQLATVISVQHVFPANFGSPELGHQDCQNYAFSAYPEAFEGAVTD